LRRRERGLTLIEILITVAIIGLIMGLSVGFFRDSSEDALERVSNQLAGTIKYVFNESAVKNRYYRLVIDLSNPSFSVEASAEPFKVAATDEGVAAPPEGGTLPEAPPPSPEGEAATQPAPGGGTFSGAVSYLLKPIQLPESLRIKDVYVAHADKKIEEGKTAIYFFPDGWVEKAVINLSDEKGEVFYSLETQPISGRVKIRNEYYDYKPEKEEE